MKSANATKLNRKSGGSPTTVFPVIGAASHFLKLLEAQYRVQALQAADRLAAA
jgi:hypothetical protein